MLIEISEGEALDRLSILEIKKNRIHNPLQLLEIEKEINNLSSINSLKEKYILYYKLLVSVNISIWDKMNLSKEIVEINSKYAQNAYEIFVHNQQRFRIKNIINYSENSNLKEQKSYLKQCITCIITSNKTLDELLYLFSYLLITYDSVKIVKNEFVNKYMEILYRYLPSLIIIDDKESIVINDNDINIPEEYKYELIPIILSILSS
jgi:hypothetical protein